MSAPKFFRKMAILAVIEATVGTLAVVTAANAIEVSDVTLTPIPATIEDVFMALEHDTSPHPDYAA